MKLRFINKRGQYLDLVKNQYFTLVGMDGMTTATSSLSSVVIGGVDGDEINNTQAQPRQINLYLKMKETANVEEAKRAILGVIKLQQNGSLEWQQNNKTLKISGLVEIVDMPRWEQGVIMLVALHCEQPFWEDIDFIVQQIKEAINLHYFTSGGNMLAFPESGIALGEYDISRTKHINNAGDVAVGMEIEILAYKTVTNPIIYDTDGNFFGVGYGNGDKKVTMQIGDVIRITTQKGHKTVTMNGTSIMGRIRPQSTWLQLQAGENTFSINSEDNEIDNVSFSLIFKQRYI